MIYALGVLALAFPDEIVPDDLLWAGVFAFPFDYGGMTRWAWSGLYYFLFVLSCVFEFSI